MTDGTRFHRECRRARQALPSIAAVVVFALSLTLPVATDLKAGITANNAYAEMAGEGSANLSSADRGHNDPSQVQAPEGQVTMAMFTTQIKKRYPADEITSHANPHRSVSFFSELQAFAGREITHRWLYGGKLKFEATFKIRASLWRVWSTQLLPEDSPGRWTVEIVDERGKVLATRSLDYAPESTDVAAN